MATSSGDKPVYCNSGFLAIGGAIISIGGAVTVGLAHYSTMGEVDHLVRTLASLG